MKKKKKVLKLKRQMELKPRPFIYDRINYLIKYSPKFKGFLHGYATELIELQKSPVEFNHRRLKVIQNLEREFFISPEKAYKPITKGILLELLDGDALYAMRDYWFNYLEWENKKLDMRFNPSFKLSFDESSPKIDLEIKSPISRQEFEDLWNHVDSLQQIFYKNLPMGKNASRNDSSARNLDEDLMILRFYFKSNHKRAKAKQEYLKFKATHHLEPKMLEKINKKLNFNYAKELGPLMLSENKKLKRFTFKSIKAVEDFDGDLNRIRNHSPYFRSLFH